MFIAVAATLIAAAQTAAPDLQCILDRMPAATRSALVDEAISARSPQPAAEALVAAINVCRQERGWDDNAAGSLGVLAHSYITGEQSRGRLESAGLDPQLITAWFDAQTLSARTDMVITETTMERLFAHLRGAGITEAMIEGQVESIGAFYASLVLIERLHEGLPVE